MPICSAAAAHVTDLKRFAATIVFWGGFAVAECVVIVPLAGALSGKGESAALALIVILIACMVGGAVFAVPRYNTMMKAMDRRP